MPQNTRVLVSGASIAGPSLALWLERYGFEVTVVEKAAEVRRGGQAVDFKGKTHLTVLERMGVLDEVRAARVLGVGDGVVVDSQGRKIATMPAELASGDLEIERGELARILVGHTLGKCEYLFGDAIDSLTQTEGGVEVTFRRAGRRTFDLVVGADGLHSNVRRLAFGPEARYVRHLGYHYALADLGGEADDAMYNEPGRMAMTGGPKGPAFFVFASGPLQYERDDVGAQKRLLVDAFRGMGWRVPELMAKVPGAREFYLDAVARATVERYAEGRVVLLGDAAYGNTLGGFGTGLAVVGAYVLAGELRRADGDHRAAYAQYEGRFRKYASVSQKVNAGSLLAPKSRLALWARNRMFSVAPLLGGVMRLMDRFANDIELDDYGQNA